MSVSGFPSLTETRRPGAGRGGAQGRAGNAPEGEAAERRLRREGGHEERGHEESGHEESWLCDFVWLMQLPLPAFLAVSPLHLWPLLRSCAVSNLILGQSLKTTCAFSHGTKPYGAFRYLTKCAGVSRGSTLGIFLWLLIYFHVCSFPLSRTLHLPVGQSR